MIHPQMEVIHPKMRSLSETRHLNRHFPLRYLVSERLRILGWMIHPKMEHHFPCGHGVMGHGHTTHQLTDRIDICGFY